MSAWNREQTRILIKLYKDEPVLYDTTNPNYCNRQKREQALRRICSKLHATKPNVTTTELKRRLNNIRSQYVREKKNILSNLATGIQYEPMFWCYKDLQFLETITRTGKQREKNSSCFEILTPSDIAPSSTQPTMKKTMKKRRREEDQETRDLIQVCTNMLNTSGVDEFEAVGINVQSKLKKMSENQQVYAEMLISKILTMGMLGKLQESSDVINCP